MQAPLPLAPQQEADVLVELPGHLPPLELEQLDGVHDLGGGHLPQLQFAQQVDHLAHDAHEAERAQAEAGRTIVEGRPLERLQVGRGDGVVHDALVPAVALLDEVLQVEGRLFLYERLHPLDGLAVGVLEEGGAPVLSH